jgi:chromosome segregation ATPase
MRHLRLLSAAALACAAGCVELDPQADSRQEGLAEPEVFDVIRAANSKAAVEQLRDRHERELEHARALEARIGELMAAEEGLAAEHRERLAALQQIKDQLRKLAEEQEATARAIEAQKQENAALEKALADEQARRDEIEKKKADGG